MADRQDIDALLIGALYGELDGDERARLEAHLASHPQDRSALDGLRSTRELLREAELPVSFAASEPSPAITAMLLQEAARRAPAPASRGGFLAFLASLIKPFAASPALSAAAALVLVGGSAGLMYSRGTFRATEPTIDNHAAVRDTVLENTAAGSAAPTPLTPSGPSPSGQAVDDYRVALADGENAATGQAGVDRGVVGDVAGGFGDDLARNSALDGADNERKGNRRAGTASGGGGSVGSGAGSGLAFSAPATATAKLDSTRPGYIALDKQSKDEPTVLALDGKRFESEVAAEAANGERDEDQSVSPTVAKKTPARVALAEGRSAGAGAGGNDAPAAAPPPPTAGATAPQKPVAGKSSVQQVARDQGKAGGKAYDPVKAAQLDSWARDQHSRMVKLVNAGKCTDAGTVGAEIARKNPEYYQANVANDRAVRACRSYVDRARRAKNEDAKTKAAAPRANAPDSPYQADMESSK